MWFYFINSIIAIICTSLLHSKIALLHHSGILTFASFFLVFVGLWLLSFIYNRKYFKQFPRIISLILFFIKELIIANLRVSYEVLTPKNRLNPAIISIPLEVDTDFEIMVLANMITLTPGTLSLDVAEDHKHLLVHTLYSEGDLEVFRHNIKEGFERKILATRIINC